MPQMVEDPEFEHLAKHGFSSEYVYMKAGVCKPIITVEGAIAQGFFPRGTKVQWQPNAGWPTEQERAREMIGDQILTVKSCAIGSSYSTYTFEEIMGQWNTVMFKKLS